MEQNIQVNSAPRILIGNSTNFARTRGPNEYRNYIELPLCMDAWAQTTMDDFSLITHDSVERMQQLEKENEMLRDRIRELENDLRVHSDLLNQIHATAALKTITRNSTENISNTPPATPITHNVQQQYQYPKRNSPNQTMTYATTSISVPQIMNSMQSNIGVCVATSDSINYTIVSKEQNIEQQQNIEIHLAEEDGAINLNNSADSGRLEICLSEQEINQSQDEGTFRLEGVKEDNSETKSLPALPAQSGILVKRRKIMEEYQTSYPAPNNRTEVNALQTNQRITPNKASNELTESSEKTLRDLQDENVMVSIGPNNTRVPYKLYESINWENPSIATRKLLMAIFDRNTLATHSMTGKPSPAFKGQAKPQKKRLDPNVTEDIVFVVTRRCKVSDKEVRNAITTKCADENKMMKLQMNKKQRNNTNKENQQHYTNGMH